MPPEIRRCQHPRYSGSSALPAALHSLPPHLPSCPHLQKPTCNMKNLPENSLPPHILSSPNGSACDQIHCMATGSRGEGKLCVVSRAQVHSVSEQPSPQSCHQHFTSSTRAGKITPSAQGIKPLLP